MYIHMQYCVYFVLYYHSINLPVFVDPQSSPPVAVLGKR